MHTYYFVGIKGSGMSALAQILHDRKYIVRGSDVDKYFFTEEGLVERNIDVLVFNRNNIDGQSVYIIGNAFDETNEEVEEIKKRGYEYYNYGEFLSIFLNEFISVAISGTHGKTTTTSMLTHIFQETKGVNSLIGDGTGIGNLNSELLLFEACEYKGTFMKYHPDFVVINNIDYDHPDHFKNIDQVFDTFNDFAKNAKTGIIVNGDDPYASRIRTDTKIFTFGLKKGNDISAKDISYDEDGTRFTLLYKGEIFGEIIIPLYGEHNVYNALAVISVALMFGLELSDMNDIFSSYEGAKRRFEIEEFQGYTIVDDYAHHPEEIEKTIQAAKQKYPNKKVVAVFQPHTYTRFLKLSEEFKESLSEADEVYLCNVFSSEREKKSVGITIEDVMPEFNHLVLEDVGALINGKNDVLLFLGAGDINKYIKEVKKIISEN